MTIKDVAAETMYDVLHDSLYRKKWDPTMLESFDVARLSSNADVGYYSCKLISTPNLSLYCIVGLAQLVPYKGKT